MNPVHFDLKLITDKFPKNMNTGKFLSSCLAKVISSTDVNCQSLSIVAEDLEYSKNELCFEFPNYMSIHSMTTISLINHMINMSGPNVFLAHAGGQESIPKGVKTLASHLYHMFDDLQSEYIKKKFEDITDYDEQSLDFIPSLHETIILQEKSGRIKLWRPVESFIKDFKYRHKHHSTSQVDENLVPYLPSKGIACSLFLSSTIESKHKFLIKKMSCYKESFESNFLFMTVIDEIADKIMTYVHASFGPTVSVVALYLNSFYPIITSCILNSLNKKNNLVKFKVVDFDFYTGYSSKLSLLHFFQERETYSTFVDFSGFPDITFLNAHIES